MAAVPGGRKGLPSAKGRSRVGGTGVNARTAGTTQKVRFTGSRKVYAGGGQRGNHLPGSVPA